jgi:hypothetical protein
VGCTKNTINVVDVNQQLGKMHHQHHQQYVLDYHDYHNQTNSISTTTTSGTMEHMDMEETNSQDSDYSKQMSSGVGAGLTLGVSSSNGYISHLANTTNTESTVNESSEFNYNFENFNTVNRPHGVDNKIRECDVVDVGKVLKSRNYLMSGGGDQQASQAHMQQESYIKIAPATLINKNFNQGQVKDTGKYYNAGRIFLNFYYF